MQRTCGMPCARFWSAPRNDVERRLGGAGWGLFFLWVGLSFLLDVGWGVGLLGVGILALLMQAVRSGFRLPVERFWILVGSVLIVAGTWELLALRISLGSLLFIFFGGALLIWSFRPRIER
jgi:hypothetical protein